MFTSTNKPSRLKALLEVLGVSLRLGLTSFGGPTAHLGYFHHEYVRRRAWMDERSYADLVGLCQFLPGPASSQVGIAIGTQRAGLAGGVAAWLGFTLPSVILLVAFALLVQGFDLGQAGWIHGLKIVAVAVVAHAIAGMGKNLAPDRTRITIAVLTAAAALLWQSPISQIALILLAGLIGVLLYRKADSEASAAFPMAVSHKAGLICLIVFFAILLGLPLLRGLTESHGLSVFDSFYRAGSLVFGGGHVVLPLLEQETVPQGWVSREDFLAGYGAAQAAPGPLFTFAAYLGAMNGGILGAAIATVAIFLPAFLLVIGVLPFWNSLRHNRYLRSAMLGINAAVVGLLLAALYNPLWTSSIRGPADFALAGVLYVMLAHWKLPPWVVVLAGALGGLLLQAAG